MKKSIVRIISAGACLALFTASAQAALVTKNDYLNVRLPNAESSADDMFSVEGKNLVLLDKKTFGEKEAYLVIEDEIAAQRRYNGSQDWNCLLQKFETVDPTGIGYWLNNTTDGYITTMPVQNGTNMSDYVIENEWETEPWINRYTGEPDGWANAYTTPYTVTAKMVIPSVTELRDYGSKIGYKSGNWWTRTAYMAWSDGSCMTMVKADGTMREMSGGLFGVRAMYWLDEDFFKSMKISLGDAGKNVLNTMSTDFTEEELSGIYSSEEIDIIMGKTNIEKPVASNAAISGSGETTTQMTATADGDENTASFHVVWEMSQTSAESGFSKVGEGETITVTNAIASANGTYIDYQLDTEKKITRWVRAAITPVSDNGKKGDTIYSAAKQMPAALGSVAAEKIKIPYMQNAKAADTFTVKGKKFTLLNGENGEFFVIADDTYGTIHSFDGDNTQKYDPEDANNIGYYVNNTIMGTGEDSLPAIVREHAVSKTWRTEAAAANGNAPQDYAFTAKATLLSMAEWLQYQDKIGADCGDRWLLRTADGRWCADAPSTARIITPASTSNNEGNVDLGVWTSSHPGYFVRPVMYLDRNFFLDAKIPAAELGDNVRTAMKSEYTLEELGSVYSAEELATYFGTYMYSIENTTLTVDEANSKAASFSIVSNAANDTSAEVIIAVYDENFKTLKGVNVKNVQIKAGQTVSDNISVNIANGTDSDKVKLMAVDGWTNIAPLCGAVVVK